MPVEKVDYAVAEDFKTILAKGRSRTSANIYLQNFMPFFSWMLKRGYLDANPFDGLTLYRVGEVKRPIYEPEEIERILAVGGLRWNVAVLLALCSMRRAEVLNLVVKDIDYAKGHILVSPKRETAETWAWNIKDHNQAIVPMTTRLANLLLKLQSKIKDRRPYLVLKPDHYERMMRLKAEGKLSFEDRNCPWPGFDRDYRALLKRAAVKHKRFQDLRATFATTMARHGMSMKETQTLMRHSSINTTAKHYLRVEEEQIAAKASKIVEKYYVTNVP
jgi:integrase